MNEKANSSTKYDHQTNSANSLNVSSVSHSTNTSKFGDDPSQIASYGSYSKRIRNSTEDLIQARPTAKNTAQAPKLNADTSSEYENVAGVRPQSGPFEALPNVPAIEYSLYDTRGFHEMLGYTGGSGEYYTDSNSLAAYFTDVESIHTTFRCDEQEYSGYYSDMDAECKVRKTRGSE